MRKYIAPAMDLVVFDERDVITTSGLTAAENGTTEYHDINDLFGGRS